MENFNYKLIISYNGTNFFGFAKQIEKRTVQQVLEEKISELCDEKIFIHSSGRTDKYVHAINQVISFKTKKNFVPSKIKKILNKIIPEDIFVKSVSKVPSSFHARFSALNKTYMYRIIKEKNIFLNDYTYFYDKEINIKNIKVVATTLIGTHNFLSFSTSELSECIRTINFIKFKNKKNELIIEINADGFLRNMVRMIIACFLSVNENKKTLESVKQLLEFPKKGSAIEKVKGCGLYLKNVFYPKKNPK
ncbi:MAG: tRNA pseudouridine(38-40) synthase TruA [Mycoplasmataceae bacterium]|jgi:tRNA pseudouridine38-40 synthase|nr:tRNA pseudouridine(38-40) synthase TruA [Mycoplasmataceae bacterium]